MTPLAAGPAGPAAVIVGPTASGKSELAESLVDELDAEIVSADALQVYRGLDIGTAKPTPDERRRFRYHCVDFLDPAQRCSAGSFGRRAREAMAAIRARSRLPLIVGGSGFYVDAALGRLSSLPPSESRWRAVLEKMVARKGAEELHRWLARLDPDRAAAIGANDAQRSGRALELVLRAGRSIAQQQTPAEGSVGAAARTIGLRWPRDVLYARIEARVDAMLAAGWQQEVETLLGQGVSPQAHALQAIGYRELCAVSAGELAPEAAREQIVVATRRYAKRQLSYFGRLDVHWIDVDAATGPGSDDIRAAALTVIRSGRDEDRVADAPG